MQVDPQTFVTTQKAAYRWPVSKPLTAKILHIVIGSLVQKLVKGLTLADYTKLMPAVDDPTPSPVKSVSTKLGYGYRDPTYFRTSCFPRYRVGTCPEVNFCQTPDNLVTWFEEATGKTEYQDTIGRTGLTIIKSKQQYAEPLPSSRRRVGDPCLRI
ncbi:uncharacterized protein LOC108744181 [Agrilus planipennis]|uniref:Uncharacterized protein LOC108744181 n=1 Tax=Agrilus planipennis TaxID=224129 RepID=A0A1W4XGR3_AGRPL|nr:uncharacterized protein LOC108744181 [Agrilus planipennis]